MPETGDHVKGVFYFKDAIMAKKIKLVQALNPIAARLIEKYQITEEKLNRAKNGRKKWTPERYRNEYLKTEHWKTMRGRALLHYGRKCYLCGRSGEDVEIEVHHNDYSRLYAERISDLIPLCDEHHEMFHKYEKGL